MDKLKQLEKNQEQEGFELALEDIKRLITDKFLELQVKNRLQLIMQYINLRLKVLKVWMQVKILRLALKKEIIKLSLLDHGPKILLFIIKFQYQCVESIKK